MSKGGTLVAMEMHRNNTWVKAEAYVNIHEAKSATIAGVQDEVATATAEPGHGLQPWTRRFA